MGGGESGASSIDSDECDARTPLDSVPGSPVSRDNSFGVRGISEIDKNTIRKPILSYRGFIPCDINCNFFGSRKF